MGNLQPVQVQHALIITLYHQEMYKYALKENISGILTAPKAPS